MKSTKVSSNHLKILFLEDSPLDAQLVRIYLLENLGREFHLDVVSTKVDYISAINKNKYDLILMDYTLPDFSGIEALTLAKSISPLVPLIVVTGTISEEALTDLLNHSPFGFILKENLSGLKKCIERVLQETSDQRDIAETTKTLVDMEMLLRASLGSPNDIMILAIDKKFNYLFFNTTHRNAMKQVYGTDALLGVNLLTLVTNDVDRANSKKNFDLAFKGINHSTSQEFGANPSHYFESYYSPLYNSRKEIVGATLYSHEITERIHAQRALEASEEKYRLLYSSMSQGMALHEIITDESGKPIDYTFLDINPRYTEIFGVKIEECRGKRITEVMPKVESYWIDAFGKVALTGEPLYYENYLSTTGRYYATYTYSPKPRQFAVLVTDITERKGSEDALKMSESRFKSLFTEAPLGIALTDSKTGHFYEVNPMLAKIANRTIEEMKTIDWMSITHPDDIQKDLDNMALLNAGKISGFSMEKRYLHPDGNYSWITMTIAPMMVEEKAHPCHLCMVQDITERKMAEQKTIEQNAQFSSLFENMTNPANIYQVINRGNTSKDYILKYSNKTALKTSRKSKDEIIGKSLFEIRPNVKLDELIPIFHRVWKTGVAEHSASIFYKDNKFDSYIENQIFRLTTGEIVMINNDVTEKMNMENELSHERQYLHSTLHSIGDGVIATNDSGLITSINGAAEKMTGWNEKEALNQPYEDVVNLICECSNDVCENSVHKVLKTHQSVEPEYYCILVAKDGTRHFIEECASPIKNNIGKVIGVVMVFRDVTEKRQKIKQIEYLSYHDYLTDLFNRRYYVDTFEKLNAPEKLPLGIMMLDVNGLKIINDAYGHDIGDRALKTVAMILTQTFGPNDIIARVGGDEFAILVPNTTVEQMHEYKETLKVSISKKTIMHVLLSLAIGYEVMTDSTKTLDDMLKLAENHMYRHKLAEGVGDRNNAIKAILSTLTEKYEPERIHSGRVSAYCRRLGEALELRTDDLEELAMAGMFHDIGKISIPDAIIQKPGKLTEAEFDVIKTHTEIGYQILRAADQYSDLAIHALSHHERWDGKGYPRGLKGEQIPLYSRIIGLADAFEAMTATRVYKSIMTIEEAKLELIKCSGTQFDPNLVKVFIEKVLPQH